MTCNCGSKGTAVCIVCDQSLCEDCTYSGPEGETVCYEHQTGFTSPQEFDRDNWGFEDPDPRSELAPGLRH